MFCIVQWWKGVKTTDSGGFEKKEIGISWVVLVRKVQIEGRCRITGSVGGGGVIGDDGRWLNVSGFQRHLKFNYTI